MQAIVTTQYGPPTVLKVKEVEKPAPQANEVLIRVHASAVGATDPIFRKGEPFVTRFFTGLRQPKFSIPGDVLAGEVEAVGKDVTLFEAGDQVFGTSNTTFGAHAEYKCLPEDGVLANKPTNVTYAEAAAICDGALTALPFLRDEAKIQSGQSILINGASGAVGTSAVQLSRYFGAEVTGVCSTANMDLVNSLGADQVIDYTQEDFTQNGQTYDVIFDAVGKSSFSRCKNSLKPDGVYLTTVLTPGIVLQMLWTSKFSSQKAKIAFTGLRPARDKAEDLIFSKKLVEAGKLKSVIDRSYPLEQLAEAHSYVEKGHKKGNVVITVNHHTKTLKSGGI